MVTSIKLERKLPFFLPSEGTKSYSTFWPRLTRNSTDMRTPPERFAAANPKKKTI